MVSGFLLSDCLLRESAPCNAPLHQGYQVNSRPWTHETAAMHHRETMTPISIEALASAEIKASRGSVATAEGKARFPTGQQRKWLHVDAKGILTCVAADKHTLVCTLGIPLRDLRILDPLVGSFGKHLCQRLEPGYAVAASFIASSRSNWTMMYRPGQCAIHAGRQLIPHMHLRQRESPARQPGEATPDHKQGPVHHPFSASELSAAASPVRPACLTRCPFCEGACPSPQAGS